MLHEQIPEKRTLKRPWLSLLDVGVVPVPESLVWELVFIEAVNSLLLFFFPTSQLSMTTLASC